MEVSEPFWAAAGVVATVLIAVVGWGKDLFGIVQKRRAASRRGPEVTVTLTRAAEFPGYATVPEGTVHHALMPPSPWEAPIPMLVATVRNEGTEPVSLRNAGIRLKRTGQWMELPRDRRGDGLDAPFSAHLPGRDSRQIKIEQVLIRSMLGVLQAQPADEFTVWVVDGLGKHYHSPPQDVSHILALDDSFQVAVSFEPPFTVTQIGEEDYSPEGLHLPEERPTESGKD